MIAAETAGPNPRSDQQLAPREPGEQAGPQSDVSVERATASAPRVNLSGIASYGFVNHHRLGDALEVERAHLDQLEPGLPHHTPRVLADKDLVRARLGGDASGDVHRPAEVVPLVVDHGPSVHSDVGRR